MTTKHRITEQSENPRFTEPISVENFAENLMEDLFHDIDRVLDGGSRLPTEATRPEMVSLTQIKVPQIVVPPKNTQELETEKDEKVKVAKVEESKKDNQSLDKLLLGAAFASILVTLSLWLANRGGIEKLLDYFGYVEKPNESAETLNPKAAADAKFADYMERSLNMIEQKEATQKKQQIPGIPPAPSFNNLPTVPVPANPSPNASLLLPLNRLVELMEAQVAKEPVTIPETKVVVMPQLSPIVLSAVAAAPTEAQASPKPSAASVSNASTEAAGKNVKEKPEATKAAVKPVAKPEAKGEAKAKAEAKQAVKPVAKVEPKAEVVAKVEPKQGVKPAAKVEAKPEAKAKAEPKAETAAKPEAKVKVEAEAETAAKAEPVAKVEPKAEPVAKAEPVVKAEPKAETAAKPEAKVKVEPKAEPVAKAEPVVKAEAEAPTEPVLLPPPPPAEAALAEIVAAAQIQSPVNTLVGILELGERSAALFEIDGVARRIYVGESIGASGWTLVNVANQEAVIRRNGEVRSVFVGQQF